PAQEHSKLGDIFRYADAADAALGQHVLAHFLRRLVLRLGPRVEQGDDAVGFYQARMNDIDVYVVLVAERGEAFGEIRECRIDRAADQKIRPRRARGAADDVDDRAVGGLEQRPEQLRQ